MTLKESLVKAFSEKADHREHQKDFDIDSLQKNERDLVYDILCLDADLGLRSPERALQNVIDTLSRAKKLLEVYNEKQENL